MSAAIALNHDILSFWILAIYFLAMPIVLRPTAKLVKRDMQLFFLFVFMLSNRSLLMGNMVTAQENTAKNKYACDKQPAINNDLKIQFTAYNSFREYKI